MHFKFFLLFILQSEMVAPTFTEVEPGACGENHLPVATSHAHKPGACRKDNFAFTNHHCPY